MADSLKNPVPVFDNMVSMDSMAFTDNGLDQWSSLRIMVTSKRTMRYCNANSIWCNMEYNFKFSIKTYCFQRDWISMCNTSESITAVSDAVHQCVYYQPSTNLLISYLYS